MIKVSFNKSDFTDAIKTEYKGDTITLVLPLPENTTLSDVTSFFNDCGTDAIVVVDNDETREYYGYIERNITISDNTIVLTLTKPSIDSLIDDIYKKYVQLYVASGGAIERSYKMLMDAEDITSSVILDRIK